MKEDVWKNIIVNSLDKKDSVQIDLICEYLEQADQAKQELRNKGYGWTGLSLLKTVQEEVPPNTYK